MMTSKEFGSCLSHKARKSGLVDEPANENVLENKDMLNRPPSFKTSETYLQDDSQ